METTALTKTEALKKKARGKKGFTLIELVIVIAVLAIIAVIAIPTIGNVVNNANISADASNAQSIETACKTLASELRSGQTVNKKGTTTPLTIDVASGTNEATVQDAMDSQAITVDITKPKQAGTATYYYTTTGHIYVATTKAATTDIALATTVKLSAVIPAT